MQQHELIAATETDIARLLCRLEEQTGLCVGGVQFRDVDITKLSDSRPRVTREVRLELRALEPAVVWATGESSSPQASAASPAPQLVSEVDPGPFPRKDESGATIWYAATVGVKP